MIITFLNKEAGRILLAEGSVVIFVQFVQFDIGIDRGREGAA